jgi:hypothetical protein
MRRLDHSMSESAIFKSRSVDAQESEPAGEAECLELQQTTAAVNALVRPFGAQDARNARLWV